MKSGAVRRSKLYYLRERSGKSARIAEKTQPNQSNDLKKSESIDLKENKKTKSIFENKTESDLVKTKTKERKVEEIVEEKNNTF